MTRTRDCGESELVVDAEVCVSMLSITKVDEEY
jgi:hypothetical protein